jgi:tetratricopeptide (TPR) repeat protein
LQPCLGAIGTGSDGQFAPPDQRIAACTSIIQSSRAAPELESNAYYLRGNAYLDEDRYDEAISDESDAIRLDPNHAGAFALRGRGYQGKGQFDQALADENKAIALNPHLEIPFVFRGSISLYKEQYDRALQDYDQAIRINPSDYNAFFGRARAYDGKRLFARAIGDYDQTIHLNPRFPDAFYLRGLSYGALGKTDPGIADLGQAIRLNPNYAEAFYYRGLFYKNASQYRQAIADFDQALRIKPDYGEAQVAKQEAVQAEDAVNRRPDAADQTFICNQADIPEPTIVTVSTRLKMMRLEVSTSVYHGRCTFEFVDGRFGNTLQSTAGFGPGCALVGAMNGEVQQHVMITRAEAKASSVQNGYTTSTISLDFATGILRTSQGAVVTCHRAHG